MLQVLYPLQTHIGKKLSNKYSQVTCTCSKSKIEALEKVVKYVQS